MMHLEIDRCGLRDSTLEEFKQVLPHDRARWIIYDFDYNMHDSGMTLTKTKLLLIVYSPESNTNN